MKIFLIQVDENIAPNTKEKNKQDFREIRIDTGANRRVTRSKNQEKYYCKKFVMKKNVNYIY